jgi:hypothetical protein
LELSGRLPVIGCLARELAPAASFIVSGPSARHSPKGTTMDLSSIALTPLISLIAGVLILVMPRLLNYIVAIYLIVAGLLGLFPNLGH